MNTIRICPECQQPLPADSPEGLCPACLVNAGLETEPVAAAGLAAAQARSLPEPGEQFGGYLIVRELGRGGMGAVYEAEQLETGRRVALKVLGHKLDSPEARARFLREGRLAASINHPNSVYVFGTEEIGGVPAITMELIAGGTLQARVERDGPLPVQAAVDAVLQVVAGLEAAQGIGILHRDIKPANCFEAADGTVKIGDFGLSISTAARDANLTLEGSFLGTPAFASPEQLRGEELNARSDIYSVGVTLYYLLTGRTPFKAENMVKLLSEVLEKPVPSPRQFRPEIPRPLAAVILRCLEKTAGERFRNYDELRQALAPFSSQAPVAAPLGVRFLAGAVDSMLLGAVGTILGLLTGFGFDSFVSVAPSLAPAFLRTIAIAFVIMLLYYTLLEGLFGAAVGKAVCGLRVVNTHRNPPGVPRAFARAALFLILPPLPYWLLFGFNPYRAMASMDHPAATQLVSLLYYLLLALLFVTARRANGLASVHDLLTGTRVIRRPAYRARAVIAAVEETPLLTVSQPRVGPYHVLEVMEQRADGDWLLAYDTRLLRRLWVKLVNPGFPPVPSALRNLGRVGRLRWITGRRTATENWDAYEAPTGQPLLHLARTPQPWDQVRFWLADLASELELAAADRTLPELCPDRVWITADSRAKLLDFPAPGLAETHRASAHAKPVSAADFLAEVAEGAVHGISSRGQAGPGKVQAPLPLHARSFLGRLRAMPSTSSALAALEPLLRQPAAVSRSRRIALTALCAAFPIVAGLGFAVSGRIMEHWQRSQPELIELGHLLEQRAAADLPWMRDSQPAPDDRMLAIYIATHYRSTITNPVSWTTPLAVTMIHGEGRAFAERSLQEHPQPTAEEVDAAARAIAPFLPKTGQFDLLRMPWFPFVVGSMVLSTMVAPLALLCALLFRGGLLLRLLGLAVTRKDGSPASRLRTAWRGLIAWLPFLVLPLVLGGLVWIAAPFLLLALVLTAWSLALPQRSLQDRLAGTWLVPR